MKFYDKPCCLSVKEFEEDLNRIFFIKKLVNRYRSGEPLQVRLILNHIIILNNLFNKITPALILFKHNKDCWHILIPFFLFLNILPEEIPEIDFIMSDHTLDQHVIDHLRKI